VEEQSIDTVKEQELQENAPVEACAQPPLVDTGNGASDRTVAGFHYMKTTASTKLSDVEPDENRKDEKEDFGEKTAVPGKDQECQTEDLEQKTEKKMGSKLELETEDPEAVEHEDDVRSGKDDQKTATVEELRGF